MVGGILFPFSKLRNSYYIINQFIRKVKNFFRHFATVPNYQCITKTSSANPLKFEGVGGFQNHQSDEYQQLTLSEIRRPILPGRPKSPRETEILLLYKAESGFSILTEECLTFQTTSPARKYGTPESPSTRNCGEEAYQGRRAHVLKNTQYQ